MKRFCIFSESLQSFKMEKKNTLPSAFSVISLQSNGNDVQAPEPEHHSGAPAELLRLPDEGRAHCAARKHHFPAQSRPQLLLFLGLLMLT